MIAPLVARRDPFWSEQKRELGRARRALRRDPAAAVSRCEPIFERLDAWAEAEGDRGLARLARKAARPFVKRRAIETDRELLERLRAKSIVSREATAGLEAAWEELSRRRLGKAAASLRGRRGRRLRRALARRAKSNGDPAERLAAVAAASEDPLPRLPQRPSDRDLRRRLETLRRKRTAAAGGSRALPRDAEVPEDPALRTIERWRDLRRFARRLARERDAAEIRGAVTLALALDAAIAAVGGAERDARRAAVDAAARPDPNVVAFRRRSA